MTNSTTKKSPIRPNTDKFTLQKYRYIGWQKATGNIGDIVYVDTKNVHPDPAKLLIWGFRPSGAIAPGDYTRFFSKVEVPKTFTYKKTGRTAMEERASRTDAIRRVIKKGW